MHVRMLLSSRVRRIINILCVSPSTSLYEMYDVFNGCFIVLLCVSNCCRMLDRS